MGPSSTAGNDLIAIIWMHHKYLFALRHIRHVLHKLDWVGLLQLRDQDKQKRYYAHSEQVSYCIEQVLIV